MESLRSRFNPVQFSLIRSHVTLCRENEVEDWEAFSFRLARSGPFNVSLAFDRPVREGNLVYLPAVESVDSFDALRYVLLGNGGSRPRKQPAHITLIHPRNGACTDAVFGEILSQFVPFSTTFDTVTLIEQTEGGRWRDIATFR
ncbi:MAG TPA: 2'-5' RNA ligase family protein [Thermoanaerobaculia bacterium]|nr:2'-5' RNA ligase family protein [Thermoanaerobaculia bacterium]